MTHFLSTQVSVLAQMIEAEWGRPPLEPIPMIMSPGSRNVSSRQHMFLVGTSDIYTNYQVPYPLEHGKVFYCEVIVHSRHDMLIGLSWPLKDNHNITAIKHTGSLTGTVFYDPMTMVREGGLCFFVKLFLAYSMIES